MSYNGINPGRVDRAMVEAIDATLMKPGEALKDVLVFAHNDWGRSVVRRSRGTGLSRQKRTSQQPYGTRRKRK